MKREERERKRREEEILTLPGPTEFPFSRLIQEKKGKSFSPFFSHDNDKFLNQAKARPGLTMAVR